MISDTEDDINNAYTKQTSQLHHVIYSVNVSEVASVCVKMDILNTTCDDGMHAPIKCTDFVLLLLSHLPDHCTYG